MNRILDCIVHRPILSLCAVLLLAALGLRLSFGLPVDVFPDIAVPRVVLQTEAPGLTAEEVEQRVSIPLETAMNGIPGVATIRSSSGGGLSFVWVDFDWNVDLARARFDVFERLQRVRETLPREAEVEIAPPVSVTGEIMLVALTGAEGASVSPLELREAAEFVLRPRLLGVGGIGEVAVLGGRLPEYRVSVSPRRLAEHGLSVPDVVEAVRDTRTSAGAGYLPNVAGDELPLRQVARADMLEEIARSPVVAGSGGALRLGDVARVELAGAPRRGSASFDGRAAVVLSVQKVPGGNTPEITKRLDAVLADFAAAVREKGVEVHVNAYRQADFIGASIAGGARVVRDAVVVVLIVLGLTLLRVRTILVVLASMALTMPVALAMFPVLGLGVNVMTLGGFAVAAGDIVDAAIIFTEVVWRRRDLSIAAAAKSVLPGVAFSTLIVALVFLPLLLLSGLEGSFFRPLALAFLAVFVTSLAMALVVVPALSRLLGRDRSAQEGAPAGPYATPIDSLGVRAMKLIYRPFLALSLRVPILVVAAAAAATVAAVWVAKDFGSSFLPSFREDAFNVALSLPPGASLDESERVAEACVAGLREIPGVLSVTRRTGRAERDQHAEPVSSSEYVVRVDLDGDVEAVRRRIRAQLGEIPGCSVLVGYPIAHRIGAVLSGTEAELAVNVYGDDLEVLRDTVAKMKARLEAMKDVSDVRANREVTVRTLRIDYDLEALAETGLTLREAGEQVSAAFNGVEVGEVRDGLRRRAVVVRLEGVEDAADVASVKSLLLSSRGGRRVRLDDVARVAPEEASDLMLREGGRRKAMISLNAAEDVSTGDLVARLRAVLDPLARDAGCSVEYGGSYQARESAARRLGLLAAGLLGIVFVMLVLALGELRAALLALVNVPLGLVGGVAAVAWADPVLSVSSLVGFVTVVGFVLRNGLLLLQRYRERLAEGLPLAEAIREGSLERMVPIVLTSLTTVFGLVPIILAGNRPGGELLAPLAVVQFGGILGATVLNLVVLPAAAKLVLGGRRPPRRGAAVALALTVGALAGCRSYTAAPVDWTDEDRAWNVAREVRLATLDDVARVSLVGNADLNRLRLKLAASRAVAQATGWWEDPELDFDFLRIVRPSENPFLMGANLAFTIPLSGVPELERRTAEAYSAADAAEIRATEAEIAAAARQAAVRLVFTRLSQARLRDFDGDARIVRAFAAAERLASAGELKTTDVASARRRRHERQHRLYRQTDEVDAADVELRKLLGLAPSVKLVVELDMDRESGPATNAVWSAVDFVRHPRVVAALSRLAGGEQALETEIRRQYPDLKFGPAYEREEGMDRMGLVLGATLPLWNRNRKGIATAEGERNLARTDAIAAWRKVVAEADAAARKYRRLVAHGPERRPRRDVADALADAGELGPLDYLAVREEQLEAELAELDWRLGVRLAEEELRKFVVEEEK